jgi:hypothetical protein
MITELLERICTKLDEHEIPYMLSGSLAMITYTIPRMTRDIDMVVNLRQSDIENFLSIFKEGYYIHADSVREEVRRRGMFNVIDFKTNFKIDFILRKNTEFHINEFDRRELNKAYGFDTWIVSIEDLVIAKIQWIQVLQSDTQINDIKNLLRNPILDKEYVKKWCEKMDLKTFNLLDDA